MFFKTTLKPVRKRRHNRNTDRRYEEETHRGRNQMSSEYEKMFHFLNNWGITNTIQSKTTNYHFTSTGLAEVPSLIESENRPPCTAGGHVTRCPSLVSSLASLAEMKMLLSPSTEGLGVSGREAPTGCTGRRVCRCSREQVCLPSSSGEWKVNRSLFIQ